MLFRRTPQVIAWAGDVAEPGDIVAREVAGVPVIVTRHQDGEFRLPQCLLPSGHDPVRWCRQQPPPHVPISRLEL